MNSYDPGRTPNPSEWLALDEQQRIQLVEEHHSRARIPLPNLKVHAIIHTIVENQLAENLPVVVRAIARLTREGLDRHEAIHAIASLVAEHIHDLFNEKVDSSGSNAIYAASVERLSASRWRGG